MNKRNVSNSSNISDYQDNSNKKMNLECDNTGTLEEEKKVDFPPLISTEELKDVPEPMPAWAKFFATKFNELNASVQFIGQNIDSALTKFNTLESKINSVEKDTTALKADSRAIHTKIESLKHHYSILETEMRKSNMVLSGIKDCASKVKEIFKDMPSTKTKKIPIGKCYRLGAFIPGKTRDVLCEFRNKTDKHTIFKNKKELPESVYNQDDLSSEVNSKRRELMPIFKLAKSKEAYSKITKFKGDRLYIGRTGYSTGNLHQLPPDISPSKACTRENDDCLVFFGKHSPYSNFYPCDIIINGNKYHCAEQYLQEQKAIFFNDWAIAKKIKQCSSALEAKSLSYKISGFDFHTWSAACSEYIETVLKQKFSQNPICKHSLLATCDKRLGEATKDKTYGIRLSLDDEGTLNLEKWTGKNLMGRTLELVRMELSKSKS